MPETAQNCYAPKFGDLPQSIPIFPLSSVLLLPHGDLPLNIFEPRYLQMVDDALRSHRLIGMIQPVDKSAKKPDIHAIGCAGKIVEFSETPDGRYQISLSGICRFRVSQELDVTTKYRQIEADWSTFAHDLDIADCLDICRDKLTFLLKEYFKLKGMGCDWVKIDEASDQKLITCLSMVCPLEPKDKQALLEATDCQSRAKLFKALLEMVIRAQGGHIDDIAQH